MRLQIRLVRSAALLLSCGLLSVLAACSRPAPEQVLRDTIASMQSAIEARDAAALEQHLAADFIGPDGMDRKQAGQLARVVFLRSRDVGATIGPLDVSLQDGHATVHFTAALTGGSGGLLPDSAEVYEVDTAWRMRGDAWELVSADWKPRM